MELTRPHKRSIGRIVSSLLLAIAVIGSTPQRAQDPADSESDPLVLVGRLARLQPTPACGGFHFGAVADYVDLEVVTGEYDHSTVQVIHGCPELKRSEYQDGSGDLEAFRVGDRHRLTLVDETEFEGTVIEGKRVMRAPRFYCVHVTLESRATK